MATTENNYTKSNTNGPSFSFTFPYLKPSDVTVTVNGVTQTQGTDYVLNTATSIEFQTGSIPATGTAIRIFRTTNVDQGPVNSFFTGSSIQAENLNTNFDQVIYHSQEITTDLNNTSQQLTTDLNNATQQLTTDINNVNQQLTTDISNTSQQLTTYVNNTALLKSGGTMTGPIVFSNDQDRLGTEVSSTPPSNPSQGDTWYDSVSGRTYVYYTDNDSSQWVDAYPEALAIASQAVGSNPPSNPLEGDTWWDSVSGRTFVYYEDGDSSQWVDAYPEGLAIASNFSNGILIGGSSPAAIYSGDGSPEGVVTAPLGSLYLNVTSSATSDRLWVKENSGVNTGWVSK